MAGNADSAPWAMFDDTEDMPWAIVVDQLTSYMVAQTREDRGTARTRIERVLREQVDKRNRQERREFLVAAGAGL
jgi:hypothetical protein